MASEWLGTAAEIFSAVGTVGAFLLGFTLLRREHRREADRAEDERRAQAASISAWIEAHRRPDGTRELKYHIHNASDMPIYDVELPLPTPADDGAATEFVGLVPPGQTIRRPAPAVWLRTYVEPEPVQIEFLDSAPAAAGPVTNKAPSPTLIETATNLVVEDCADGPHGECDGRARLTDGLRDYAARAVPREYLAQPRFDADRFTIGTRGHVAVEEGIGHEPVHRRKLARQFVTHAPFARLDDGAGVVSDEPAQRVVGVLDVAEVTGAVQRMEPGCPELRRVADVMQPRGSDQGVCVVPDDVRNGLGLLADPLCVRPPARERLGKQPAGEVSRPGDKFHPSETSRNDQCGRTNRPLPWTDSTRPAPSSSASACRAVPRATP